MKSEITKESNQWLETATDTYKVPRDSVLIDWSRIKNGPELRILLIDKTQRKANDALKILFEENKDQITSKKRNLLSFKDGTIKYIEPQHDNSEGSGREWDDIKNLAKQGGKIQHDCRGIMRIDNKLFNTDFIEIFDVHADKVKSK